MTVDDIRVALKARENPGSTHWAGCEVEPRHRDCAIAFLLEEVDRLQAALAAAPPPPVCTHCGHADPHNGPAGDVADACTHPGCNCGFDSR